MHENCGATKGTMESGRCNPGRDGGICPPPIRRPPQRCRQASSQQSETTWYTSSSSSQLLARARTTAMTAVSTPSVEHYRCRVRPRSQQGCERRPSPSRRFPTQNGILPRRPCASVSKDNSSGVSINKRKPLPSSISARGGGSLSFKGFVSLWGSVLVLGGDTADGIQGGFHTVSGFVNGALAATGAGRRRFAFGQSRVYDRIGSAASRRSPMEMRTSVRLFAFEEPTETGARDLDEQVQGYADDLEKRLQSYVTSGEENNKANARQDIVRDKRLLTDKLKRALRPQSSLFKKRKGGVSHGVPKGAPSPSAGKIFDPFWYLPPRHHLGTGEPTLTETTGASFSDTIRSPPLPDSGELKENNSSPFGRRGRNSEAHTTPESPTEEIYRPENIRSGDVEDNPETAEANRKAKTKVNGVALAGGTSLPTETVSTEMEENADLQGGSSERKGAAQRVRYLPTNDTSTPFRTYVYMDAADPSDTSRRSGVEKKQEHIVTLAMRRALRLSATHTLFRLAKPGNPSSINGCTGTSDVRKIENGAQSGTGGTNHGHNSDRSEVAGNVPAPKEGVYRPLDPPQRNVEIYWNSDEKASPLKMIWTETDMFGEALSPRVLDFSREEQAAYLEHWFLTSVKHGVAPRGLMAALEGSSDLRRFEELNEEAFNCSARQAEEHMSEDPGVGRDGSTSSGGLEAGESAQPEIDVAAGAAWRTYGWKDYGGFNAVSTGIGDSDDERSVENLTSQEDGTAIDSLSDLESGDGNSRHVDDPAQHLDVEAILRAFAIQDSENDDGGDCSDVPVGDADSKTSKPSGNDGNNYSENDDRPLTREKTVVSLTSSGKLEVPTPEAPEPAVGERQEGNTTDGWTMNDAEPLGWRLLEAVEEEHARGERSARIIAIGDVHGCLDELKMLLRKVEYWPGDLLLFLGDLVAKGPDSVGVVKMARELEGISVRGNHEHEVLRKWSHGGGSANEAHQRIKDGLNEEDLLWLRQCPWFFSCPALNAKFVHAGFQASVKYHNQNPRFMMNMRGVDGKTSSGNAVVDSWASSWPGPTTVFFGHDAARGLQLHEYAVGLDTACVYGGQLTACILPSQELISVDSREEYVRDKYHQGARKTTSLR